MTSLRTGIAMKSKRWKKRLGSSRGWRARASWTYAAPTTFRPHPRGPEWPQRPCERGNHGKFYECTVFMGHSVWWMWSKISKVNFHDLYDQASTMSIETNWFHFFWKFQKSFLCDWGSVKALCIGRMFVVNESKNQNTCHMNSLWYMKTTKKI